MSPGRKNPLCRRDASGPCSATGPDWNRAHGSVFTSVKTTVRERSHLSHVHSPRSHLLFLDHTGLYPLPLTPASMCVPQATLGSFVLI